MSRFTHLHVHSHYSLLSALPKIEDIIKTSKADGATLVPAVAAAIPNDVQALLDERAAARKAKDFAASDRLRDEIKKRGYEVRDSGDEQILKKI